MIPIGDDQKSARPPLGTYGLLAALGLTWVLAQGAGFSAYTLAASVCNWGLVPGELTHHAPLGMAVPIGAGLACVVDDQPINVLTPITAMFLHGSWGHLLGNALFLWVFGRAVEDGMGTKRFLVYYLVCGLLAAGTHVLINRSSAVPMVGASGAIAGVLGGYLALYPWTRVRVLLLWLVVVQVPAAFMLIWWIGLQLLMALPQLGSLSAQVSAVAVWAHIGGFAAGYGLVQTFSDERLFRQHQEATASFHRERDQAARMNQNPPPWQ